MVAKLTNCPICGKLISLQILGSIKNIIYCEHFNRFEGKEAVFYDSNEKEIKVKYMEIDQ